jgi:hypothetical protein
VLDSAIDLGVIITPFQFGPPVRVTLIMRSRIIRGIC